MSDSLAAGECGEVKIQRLRLVRSGDLRHELEDPDGLLPVDTRKGKKLQTCLGC